MAAKKDTQDRKVTLDPSICAGSEEVHARFQKRSRRVAPAWDAHALDGGSPEPKRVL